MLLIDIFFIVVFGLAFINGLRHGLFRVIGSLVGLVVGAWVASHYYLLVFDWLVQSFSESWFFNKIAIFVLIFFLASNLTAVLCAALGNVLESIMIIPLMKTASRLLGGVLSLAEAALSWALIVFFLSRYLPATTTVGQQLSDSVIAPYLLTIGKILWPLLPMVLKQMQALW